MAHHAHLGGCQPAPGQLPGENERKTSRLAKFEPMKINTQMAREAREVPVIPKTAGRMGKFPDPGCIYIYNIIFSI